MVDLFAFNCLPRNSLSHGFAGIQYQRVIPVYNSWQSGVQHFFLKGGLELPRETE